MSKELTKEDLQELIKLSKDKIGKSDNIKKADEQIPQISWIVLLKLLDDFDKRKEDDKSFKPIIPKPYRWRDWATDKKITGQPLITYLTTKLFPTLRDLPIEKGLEHRILVTSVFRNTNNRILEGHTLKEIIDDVNKINFTNTNTVKIFLELYEDQIKEMKNSAKNRAEFYTPHAVVQFIVQKIKPDFKKGEKVFDPACGMSGFLLESYKHMKKFEKSTKDIEQLRYHTLSGVEKEGRYYICALLHMLLYDIDKPNLLKDDSLLKDTKTIHPKDQYHVIMTNPTYGGPQSPSRKDFLPRPMKGATPQAHFLYYVMQSLLDGGRAAVIMSNGFLSDNKKGATEIKKSLFEEFNLHTIIRLPETLFEPYNSIETNILFFDKGSPTNEIWYYKMEVPERVAPSYGITKEPLLEDFHKMSEWFDNREENDNAWKVTLSEIEDYKLDRKHPKRKYVQEELSPHKLIKEIISDEKKTLDLLVDVENLINREIPK